MFGDLRNGSFKGTAILVGMGIEEYRKNETECVWPYVLFWVVWVIITVGAIILFYIIDNEWLEG